MLLQLFFQILNPYQDYLVPVAPRKEMERNATFSVGWVLTLQGWCPTRAVSHQCDQLPSPVLGHEDNLPAQTLQPMFQDINALTKQKHGMYMSLLD